MRAGGISKWTGKGILNGKTFRADISDKTDKVLKTNIHEKYF